jgi:hypothetical protein
MSKMIISDIGALREQENAMTRPIPDIVIRWHATWSTLDPDRIAALFCENGTHMSPYVNDYIGLSNAVLKSREAIRLYAEVVAKRVKSFDAEIISVISDYDDTGGRAAVEYWRTLGGKKENRRRSVEMLEWVGDEIISCRVYHF